MRSCNVAVIGAGRLVGRETLRVLRERQFPVGRLSVFDTVDYLGRGDVEGAEPLEPLEQAQLGGAEIVFLAATELLSVEWAPRAVAAGAVVIDLTQAFAEHPDVPLVVPEANPSAVADHVRHGIISCPAPGAIALAVTLGPIEAAAGLKRVVTATYEPVSAAGDEGIEELSAQTRELMNGRSVEPEIFPQRVAFNLIPQVGELLDGGESRAERQILTQVRRLLERPDLPISVSSVWVPTFFGQGYAVNVETEQPLGAAEACALLGQAPGVVLVDEASSDRYATAADAVGGEAVFVGRVRRDPSVAYGLNLWVTLDGTRKGAAVNAVQIAEILARDYL